MSKNFLISFEILQRNLLSQPKEYAKNFNIIRRNFFFISWSGTRGKPIRFFNEYISYLENQNLIQPPNPERTQLIDLLKNKQTPFCENQPLHLLPNRIPEGSEEEWMLKLTEDDFIEIDKMMADGTIKNIESFHKLILSNLYLIPHHCLYQLIRIASHTSPLQNQLLEGLQKKMSKPSKWMSLLSQLMKVYPAQKKRLMNECFFAFSKGEVNIRTLLSCTIEAHNVLDPRICNMIEEIINRQFWNMYFDAKVANMLIEVLLLTDLKLSPDKLVKLEELLIKQVGVVSLRFADFVFRKCNKSPQMWRKLHQSMLQKKNLWNSRVLLSLLTNVKVKQLQPQVLQEFLFMLWHFAWFLGPSRCNTPVQLFLDQNESYLKYKRVRFFAMNSKLPQQLQRISFPVPICEIPRNQAHSTDNNTCQLQMPVEEIEPFVETLNLKMESILKDRSIQMKCENLVLNHKFMKLQTYLKVLRYLQQSNADSPSEALRFMGDSIYKRLNEATTVSDIIGIKGLMRTMSEYLPRNTNSILISKLPAAIKLNNYNVKQAFEVLMLFKLQSFDIPTILHLENWIVTKSDEKRFLSVSKISKLVKEFERFGKTSYKLLWFAVARLQEEVQKQIPLDHEILYVIDVLLCHQVRLKQMLPILQAMFGYVSEHEICQITERILELHEKLLRKNVVIERRFDRDNVQRIKRENHLRNKAYLILMNTYGEKDELPNITDNDFRQICNSYPYLCQNNQAMLRIYNSRKDHWPASSLLYFIRDRETASRLQLFQPKNSAETVLLFNAKKYNREYNLQINALMFPPNATQKQVEELIDCLNQINNIHHIKFIENNFRRQLGIKKLMRQLLEHNGQFTQSHIESVTGKLSK